MRMPVQQARRQATQALRQWARCLMLIGFSIRIRECACTGCEACCAVTGDLLRGEFLMDTESMFEAMPRVLPAFTAHWNYVFQCAFQLPTSRDTIH